MAYLVVLYGPIRPTDGTGAAPARGDSDYGPRRHHALRLLGFSSQKAAVAGTVLIGGGLYSHLAVRRVAAQTLEKLARARQLLA
ncbi:MAG: hypothetical protein ACREP4_13420 [Stenotrophomonas sp.]|uniref:hypothetical protein n=1 Tax=Stenotrophomonas sp. TaxID=69392 RepID=UPI003D6D299B